MIFFLQQSKIVLDDYFNENSGRLYLPDSIPRSPLTPSETNETESPNVFSNGQHEEPTTPIAEGIFFLFHYLFLFLMILICFGKFYYFEIFELFRCAFYN